MTLIFSFFLQNRLLYYSERKKSHPSLFWTLKKATHFVKYCSFKSHNLPLSLSVSLCLCLPFSLSLSLTHTHTHSCLEVKHSHRDETPALPRALEKNISPRYLWVVIWKPSPSKMACFKEAQLSAFYNGKVQKSCWKCKPELCRRVE